MDSKTKKIILSVLALIIIFGAGFYLFKKNIGTVNIPGKTSLDTAENGENLESVPGIELPEGFALSIFAKDVPGARVIEFDPTVDMIVSSTSKGKLFAVPDRDNDGIADKVVTIAAELNQPHGIAFRRLNHDSGGLQCSKGECELFVAESDKISVYDYENTDANPWKLANKRKIADLPTAGGGHYTRTIEFGPDGRLYVSIGSSCNVCSEDDPRRAAIYSMRPDGSDFKPFAKGLRNTVFFTWNPVDGKMWGTDMGRDSLGDNIPPDEINIIEQEKNYGWPVCYGKNIHDTNFDKNTYIRNPCMAPFETPSHVDLQAHSAPLGLAFIPEEGWPEEYWYNLLVAYHGSWNRSTPTGYKIVRIKLDAKGKYLGTEDFITGWLTKEEKKSGRPVDIKVFPGGTAYISDDSSGVIYRLKVQ
jgi:glucose/arabinose dehydrogenase